MVTPRAYHEREDASSMVTAGATANTTEGNSRASRELGFSVFTFDSGAATNPGVEGGTHRRRATFERC